MVMNRKRRRKGGGSRQDDGRRRYPKRRRSHKSDSPQTTVGVLVIHKDGSGTVMSEDAKIGQLFVPEEWIGNFGDGQRVRAEVSVGRKGRLKARPLIEEARRRYQIASTRARGEEIIAYSTDTREFWALVDIDEDDRSEFLFGVVVVVEEVDRGCYEEGRMPQARVVEVLGDIQDERTQIEMATWGQDIPKHFSDATLEEVEGFVQPQEDESLWVGRKDLRNIPFVTIDGADARDFDDAVAARLEKDGIRVWVSIADVATYVKEDAPLDRDAIDRATSVYFPHKVVPMLPERLSNDLCSLRPDVIRLTLTCEFVVDRNGKPFKTDVYPSLIRSHARLTYEQVQEFFDPGSESANDWLDAVKDSVTQVRKAAGWLRQERSERGALDFDFPEMAAKLTDDGRPECMELRERLESHRVIEDMMIGANEVVAEYTLANGISALYRVHNEPKPEKLKVLGRYARLFQLGIDYRRAMDPKYVPQLVRALQASDKAKAAQLLFLQTLEQACYGPENLGHYGLGSAAYLHFTSPIRRYPDLVVHRMLWRYWRGEDCQADLRGLGEETSTKERRAVKAERDVSNLIGTLLAKRHLGETFKATVTGVHPVGLFMRLDSLWVDGLLPIEQLSKNFRDYFDYVEERLHLFGRRSKRIFEFGDELEVCVVDVDPDLRRIRLGLKLGIEKKEVEAEVEADSVLEAAKMDYLARARERFGSNTSGGASKKNSRGGGKKPAAGRGKKKIKKSTKNPR
ncbi:MAG: VacB/RNase II family 3'-5' exoribonuclease [Myxococcota bacterium]|nr:VacB/RNase II family 3'-5' exoribonuclease [Myxococcota bacterium]